LGCGNGRVECIEHCEAVGFVEGKE
jgi:hypothetical protein